MDKRRHADHERADVTNVIGDFQHSDALLFDDEVLTGGSMMAPLRMLTERGAKQIMAGCTHGVFSGAAIERIGASSVETFVRTNTIPLPEGQDSAKLETLSVANCLVTRSKRSITASRSADFLTEN
jgi:ribose-phosphate pyrophosphokinase